MVQPNGLHIILNIPGFGNIYALQVKLEGSMVYCNIQSVVHISEILPTCHCLLFYLYKLYNKLHVSGHRKSSVMPHDLPYYSLVVSRLILPIDSDILVCSK